LFLINTQELFNPFAPELNVLNQCKRQESKWLPLLHWWQLYPTWHFKPHPHCLVNCGQCLEQKC
jgi:hypothetical protein